MFMKEILTKVLLKADILGEPVSLRIDKETSSKTVIGGLLTIAFGIAIFVTFLVLSSDVFNYQNPAIALENRILEERSVLTIDKMTMPIAFGLTDEGTGITNKPTYFRYRVNTYFNKNSANSEAKEVEFKFKVCDVQDFPPITEERFYGISLNYMYCLENQNFTIKGFWNEDEIQVLSISVYFCEGEAENGEKCEDKETILEYLKMNPTYLNIFIIDTNINLQNYTNPISRNVMTRYQVLKSDASRLSELSIKNQQIRSDDSILFSNFHGEFSIAFDYEATYDLNIGPDGLLSQYQLLSSSNYAIHHRSYKKISEVLADVGGLSSVFLIVLKIICYLFTNIKQDCQILDRIFEFDMNDPNNKLTMRRGSIKINKNLMQNLQQTKAFENETKRRMSKRLTLNINDNNSKDIFNINNSNVNVNNINGKEIEKNSKNSISYNSESNSSENKDKFNNDSVPILHTIQPKKNLLSTLALKGSKIMELISVSIKKKNNISIQSINNSHLFGDRMNVTDKSDKISEYVNLDGNLDEKINGNIIAEINEENNNNLNQNNNLNNFSKKPTFIHDEESQISEEEISSQNSNSRNNNNSLNKQGTEVIKQMLNHRESNNKLKFTFCEIFRHFFFPCNKDQKLKHKFLLYKKSQSVLDEFLDISFIVQKLNEFEKMKFVMLSKEQAGLFHLVSKDICSLDNNRVVNDLSKAKEFQKNQDNIAKVIVNFMDELNNKENDNEVNEIDKKLFNIIYDEVEKNLEN